MKQRVKFALADIRYIQTQIQKILNPVNGKGGKGEPAQGEHRSMEKGLTGSPRKGQNFSTAPRQNVKEREKQTRMTSPKIKKKQSPQSRVQTTHASTVKKENNLHKNISFQQTEERKVDKNDSPPPLKQLPKQQPKQVSPHKSIMMMWKQKQKSGTAIQPTPTPLKTTTLTKIKESPQLPTPKMKAYSPPKQHFKPQPIILVQKKEIPYHLKDTNTIPLRTDESYLIKKYNYGQNKQKQQELREKYKLLDERLQRLKGQIKNRDFTVTESGDERSKESSALKKSALEKYSRYSPLSKFVRINQKLRRDYERSLSNQERRVIRQRAELESTKPKWAH